MRAPTPALIAARIAKGWTPERAASTPAPGRPMKAEQRANVSKRRRKGPDGREIVWFEAAIRETDGTRTYIRAYSTREEADTACALYMATGEKPPRKTGIRFTHSKPRPSRKGQPQPRQRAAARQIEQTPAKLDRMAMIRAAWRRTA